MDIEETTTSLLPTQGDGGGSSSSSSMSSSNPNNQNKPALFEKDATGPLHKASFKSEALEEEEDDGDVLLATLPKELVIEVFGFCSVKDVCTARGVSKGWRRLIQSDALLWRRIGRRDLALNNIEEFMTPAELALFESRRESNEVNWVDIYKRVFGGGWDETEQIGTRLSDNGRTVVYMPGDVGYRCFISKKAFDKGKHYVEVHFKLLTEGFYKGTLDSNTYGFGFGNRTIYTINSGSSYLACNNGRGWYDNGNAYNIFDEATTLTFPKWGEKDTLGVFLDLDENKAAFFKNRERVTEYFKIFTNLPSTITASNTEEQSTDMESETAANPASSLATSPPGGIHVVVLTAKGGEFTLRYCGSNPPLDVAVSLVEGH